MPTCEPVELDYIDRASFVAQATVDVAASPAQVWQVLNDTPRWPDWFEGMKSAHVTSPTWDGMGATRTVQIGPAKVDERVVTWEADQQWGFCVTHVNALGWFPKRLLEIVDIEPNGTGSTLTYTGAVDPVPWLKPLGGLLKKQLASAWSTGLANIDTQISS